ncbi:MAG: hypothetical protein QOJ98_593 [Acidobacteriota bacterium]|nr:hypothetical protein [Acidobacteriota bacterium]
MTTPLVEDALHLVWAGLDQLRPRLCLAVWVPQEVRERIVYRKLKNLFVWRQLRPRAEDMCNFRPVDTENGTELSLGEERTHDCRIETLPDDLALIRR